MKNFLLEEKMGLSYLQEWQRKQHWRRQWFKTKTLLILLNQNSFLTLVAPHLALSLSSPHSPSHLGPQIHKCTHFSVGSKVSSRIQRSLALQVVYVCQLLSCTSEQKGEIHIFPLRTRGQCQTKMIFKYSRDSVAKFNFPTCTNTGILVKGAVALQKKNLCKPLRTNKGKPWFLYQVPISRGKHPPWGFPFAMKLSGRGSCLWVPLIGTSSRSLDPPMLGASVSPAVILSICLFTWPHRKEEPERIAGGKQLIESRDKILLCSCCFHPIFIPGLRHSGEVWITRTSGCISKIPPASIPSFSYSLSQVRSSSALSWTFAMVS